MARGSKNKGIKREVVVPPKCLEDNKIDSDTDINSDHNSEMSESLFKDKTVKKKRKAIVNKPIRAEKVPICIIKTKHHSVERHKIQEEDTQEEDTQDTQEPEDEIVITSDIEQVHPVYTIKNNMANPPPPGSGEDCDPLAKLGLTPSKTHKAQRSPAKSPRKTGK